MIVTIRSYIILAIYVIFRKIALIKRIFYKILAQLLILVTAVIAGEKLK